MAALFGAKIVLVVIPIGTISKSSIKERISLFMKNCNLEKSQIITLNYTENNFIVQLDLLHSNLIEISKSFYKDREKKVKRKKNRLISGNLKNSLATTKQLSAKGWLFRYEYKLACFYEFKLDFEVAIK